MPVVSQQGFCTLIFREPCPVCNALVSFETGVEVRCSSCGNDLIVGNSDPTGHDIYEIDPDIPGGAFGEYHVNLHPKGTEICVVCQQIYPNVFECCPQLVDVAFEAYNKPEMYWTDNTQDLIVKFLRCNKIVVANTAQLRILQSHYRKIPPAVGDKVVAVLKDLALNELIDEIADELS